MKSPREAIDLILGGMSRLGAEEVGLRDAVGRVLAESAVSPIDLPACDNSAMDGFAARSDDVRGATRGTPQKLRLLEEVPAGRFPSRPIGPGEATRVFTGAPIPRGADSVIRQEDTECRGGEVTVFSDRDAGRNLRFRGEDLRRGATVLDAGTRLGPAEVGVLASMARGQVRVYRTPRVGILASGDEVADLDEPEAILAGRKIASSNSYALGGLVRQLGAVPVDLGVAADTLESVRERLERGARETDLIVSTAGISVGEFDYMQAALRALDGELVFWKVRMRPGAPLAFGFVRGVPWLGLPGNPVSTMVCFELYVRPAIRKMQGHAALFRRSVPVTADGPIRISGRLTHFLRAIVRETPDGYRARLTGPQGSGILTSMVAANALLIVPEGREEVAAGAALRAMLLGDGWMEATEPPV